MAGNPYHGEIRGLTANILHGWAWHSEKSDERVVLEFYLDNEFLGVAPANIFEPELFRQGIGDGVSGFSLPLPKTLPAGSGTIRARIANTEHWLDSSFVLEEDAQMEKLRSFVFANSGLRFSGYVLEMSNTDEPVRLNFSTEKGETWKLVADQFNEFAPEKYPYCGFDFTLPLAYADGRNHTLTIKTDWGDDVGLSPYTVVCYPEGEDGYFAHTLSKSVPDEVAAPFKALLEANRPYSPKSVSFEQYDDWFALFGAPRHKLRQRELKFGLRWVGEGDQARTRATIEAQTHSSYSWRQYGDYVALIGAGDSLPPWALAAVAEGLTRSVGMLYTDCDTDAEDGRRSDPWFKPAWDPDLFCQQNILSPLCVIEAGIFKKFSKFPNMAIPYMAARYCMENGRLIKHLPLVCYHRRAQPRNWESPGALMGFQHFRGWNRALAETPLVSIIIPTRDQKDYLKACIESIRRGTYTNIEILVVDNQSREPETLAYFEELTLQDVKILPYDAPFNFSAINNMAVEQAGGEVICLLNNDAEVISCEWLEEMLSLLLRKDTGVVGAKLLWPNRMVQHGGVLLGLDNIAGHYGNHTSDDDRGYYDQNQLVREVSAVTAACLLIRKADYLAVGGFDETRFPITFNDVDLCLKVRQKRRKRVVWTPHAKLFHDESVSRGDEDTNEKQARAAREIQSLRKSWGRQILADSAYNPNLCLDAISGAHSGLALPAKKRKTR